MKIGIFPCIGLGDGLIACALAHNLTKVGHQVEVFHPLLPQLQSFFPHLSFFARPEKFHVLKEHEKLLFIYEKLEWMQKAMEAFPEKNIVLNPIATPNQDYPYWEEGEFDGNIPFVDNLVHYLQKKWSIPDATKDNGIQLPIEVEKDPKRIIFHPTSSRVGKNWSKGKFIYLAEKLKREGYDPVFILTKEEQKGWSEIQSPSFSNLSEVAHFIAGASFMIGNDSGIGHLASCLGVSTLTICRSPMAANFWRPAWAKGDVIVPPSWIPNLKGLRWRDKKWQNFVPVSKVYKAFLKLTTLS
jgi:heptosyltransferase-3